MSYEFFKEEDYSVSCDKTVSRNNDQCLQGKDQYALLLETLQYFTGSDSFHPDNFERCEGVDLSSKFNLKNLKNLKEYHNCCCSHSIIKFYYVKHIESGFTFRVGSHCFSNLLTKHISDDDELTKIKIKKLFNTDCYCHYCGNKLNSKKKTCEQKGYCSKSCMLHNGFDELDDIFKYCCHFCYQENDEKKMYPKVDDSSYRRCYHCTKEYKEKERKEREEHRKTQNEEKNRQIEEENRIRIENHKCVDCQKKIDFKFTRCFHCNNTRQTKIEREYEEKIKIQQEKEKLDKEKHEKEKREKEKHEKEKCEKEEDNMLLKDTVLKIKDLKKEQQQTQDVKNKIEELTETKNNLQKKLLKENYK